MFPFPAKKTATAGVAANGGADCLPPELQSPATDYWANAGVLVLGFLFGLAAAYLFNSIHWESFRFIGGDIEKARKLGIISVTVLDGYPKLRDTITYFTVLGFPVLFSSVFWFLWSGKNRSVRLAGLFTPETEIIADKKDIIWRVFLVSAGALYLCYFDFHMFYSSPGSSWFYLSEEGENLAWVQNILTGKVYGRDFFCPYGPMLVYPIAWLMRIFGPGIIVQRFYAYFLDLAAYLIILALFYKALGSRIVFLVSAAVFLAVYIPFLPISPHTSYLRFGLGFLPIILAYAYIAGGRRVNIALAGLAAGQSLLFSQEAGVCSVLAVAAMIILWHFQNGPAEPARKRAWGGLFIFFAAAVISMLPMLGYFYFKGALGPLFNSVYGYPRLAMLGYAALPFPDFIEFIKSFSGTALIAFWTILVYALTAAYLLPLVVMRRLDRRQILMASLLVFGVFLFRSALARADLYHIRSAMPPALVLALMFIDGAASRLFDKAAAASRRAGSGVLLAGMAAAMLVLFLSPVMKQFSNAAEKMATDIHKYSKPGGFVLRGIPRAGDIRWGRKMAAQLMDVRNFLAQNVKKGEDVYFFPYQPAYYFIFNLNCPSRYVMSIFAITHAQRLKLITDLERARPRYVLYSKSAWHQDGIPETIYAPEVVSYIDQNYKPVGETANFIIEARK
ncbi:MAG: hypothetical protein M0Z52_08535 [Actinomycetota bacterium]|nr:hypothetical protein [Actinomycetota bacterium]